MTTDFRETSSVALQQATELASIFRARLDVLHVVEEPIGYVASHAVTV